MPVTVTCPGCQKTFPVKDKYAGKKGACPHCRGPIKIPALATDGPNADAPTAAEDDWLSGIETEPVGKAPAPVAARTTPAQPPAPPRAPAKAVHAAETDDWEDVAPVAQAVSKPAAPAQRSAPAPAALSKLPNPLRDGAKPAPVKPANIGAPAGGVLPPIPTQSATMTASDDFLSDLAGLPVGQPLKPAPALPPVPRQIAKPRSQQIQKEIGDAVGTTLSTLVGWGATGWICLMALVSVVGGFGSLFGFKPMFLLLIIALVMSGVGLYAGYLITLVRIFIDRRLIMGFSLIGMIVPAYFVDDRDVAAKAVFALVALAGFITLICQAAIHAARWNMGWLKTLVLGSMATSIINALVLVVALVMHRESFSSGATPAPWLQPPFVRDLTMVAAGPNGASSTPPPGLAGAPPAGALPFGAAGAAPAAAQPQGPPIRLSNAVFVKQSHLQSVFGTQHVGSSLGPKDISLSVDYEVVGQRAGASPSCTLIFKSQKTNGQAHLFLHYKKGTYQGTLLWVNDSDNGPFEGWIVDGFGHGMLGQSARLSNVVTFSPAANLPPPQLGAGELFPNAQPQTPKLRLAGQEVAREGWLKQGPAAIISKATELLGRAKQLTDQTPDAAAAEKLAAEWTAVCVEGYELPLDELADKLGKIDGASETERKAAAEKAHDLAVQAEQLEHAMARLTAVEGIERVLHDAFARKFMVQEKLRLTPQLTLQLAAARRVAESAVKGPETKTVRHGRRGWNSDQDGPLPSLAAKYDGADVLAKVLADLASDAESHRSNALERLGQMVPKDDRRAEVTAALEPLIAHTEGKSFSHFDRKKLFEVYAAWSGPHNEGKLIEYYEGMLADWHSSYGADSLLAALVRIKTPRAAEVVARGLDEHHWAGGAGEALRKMGPVAERAVWPYLRNGDVFVGREVCEILKVIGTEASIKPLREFQRGEGFSHRAWADDAEQAIQAIKRRMKKQGAGETPADGSSPDEPDAEGSPFKPVEEPDELPKAPRGRGNKGYRSLPLKF